MKSLGLVSALCALGLVGIARAEEAPAALGEVTVTARFRAERLEQAPVSATVLGARELEQRSVTNLAQVAAFAPNLVFDGGTGNTGQANAAQVFIRGVGQTDFVFTVEPGVGIYVDGVYMSRAIGAMMDLVDVERVEVLRGPQGTAFGRNSVGGAISVSTRRPTGEPAFRAALTAGSYNRFDVQAVASGPLIDGRLSGKLVGAFGRRDGFVDRPGFRAGGALRGGGLSGQLLYTPNADLDLRLSADYLRRRDAAIAARLVAVNPAAPLLGLWSALVAPGAYSARFVTTDPHLDLGTGPSFSNLDQWGGSASLEKRSAAGTLRSITAYRAQRAVFASDPDRSPAAYTHQRVSDRMEQFSQEVQWLGHALDGRLRYVLGGLVLTEQGKDTYQIRIAPGLYQALEALPPGVIPGLGGRGNPANVGLDYDAVLPSAIRSRSAALFAHADYDATAKLTVSAGLRQSWDHKGYRARFDRLTARATIYNLFTEQDWKALTPQVGAEYRWTPRLMTYASAARGYKAGGYNGRSQSAFEFLNGFDPEYVWTYEAGLKATALEGRLAVNGAVFQSDYSNIQLLTLTGAGLAPVVIVQNAGDARIRGFELEAVATPARGTRIDAGLGHLDARYTRLRPGATVTLQSRLPKTPPWSWSLGAEQDLETRFGLLTARVDYAWRATNQTNSANSPRLVQQAFGLLGARLTLTPPGGRWSLALFGTNLTDELYVMSGIDGLDSIGTADVNYGRPREWGVRIDRRF